MALPKISIRALQAFLAVYEEQSFSRAAERENATQSGMSTQVKNLELALGAALLERGRGHMELTAVGRCVYDGGQEILAKLFALEHEARGLGGAVTGALRFGSIPTLNRAVLPPVIERFGGLYPHVEVSVLEEYSYSLMRQVLDGALDFAVVPGGDVLPGLASVFVARDREVLVCGRDRFPAHGHLSPVTRDALQGVDLIVPSRQNVRWSHLQRYFDTTGVTPGKVMELDGMLATLEFVATTRWCAILPSVLCHPDRDGTLRKILPLSDPPLTTDYVAVRKADRALSPAAAGMLDQIRHETPRVLADWPVGTFGAG